MRLMRRIVGYCIFASLAYLTAHSLAREPSTGSPIEAQFRTVDWTDLIPADTLKILMNPPDYIEGTVDGTAEDQISSQFFSYLTLVPACICLLLPPIKSFW